MKRTSTSRRRFLRSTVGMGGAALLVPAAGAGLAVTDNRAHWLGWVERVAEPVLAALSRRELRQRMPVEAVGGHEAERRVGSHLEAFARLLAGMAPWLELAPSAGETAGETELRVRYRGWAVAAIESAVDPASPDYMRFGESGQTLVDSSFLALALLRAPTQLLASMSAATQGRLVAALVKERSIKPPFSNWLLFAALNEVLLRKLGAVWEPKRVEYALRSMEQWYVGDGLYGDGPHFHADFYNSFVMHPYLLALKDAVGAEPAWQPLLAKVDARAGRYAVVLERSIAQGGEYPVVGRSIPYRGGAFHLLADVAQRGMLPEGLAPAAVRCALAAVQQRTLGPAGTFGAGGWLNIGLAGHQPGLAETYISTGSLYLCSALWLPLGRPAADRFWADAAADWTQKRLWAGLDGAADHALRDGL